MDQFNYGFVSGRFSTSTLYVPTLRYDVSLRSPLRGGRFLMNLGDCLACRRCCAVVSSR
jgi:hypothetical protein